MLRYLSAVLMTLNNAEPQAEGTRLHRETDGQDTWAYSYALTFSPIFHSLTDFWGRGEPTLTVHPLMCVNSFPPYSLSFITLQNKLLQRFIFKKPFEFAWGIICVSRKIFGEFSWPVVVWSRFGGFSWWKDHVVVDLLSAVTHATSHLVRIAEQRAEQCSQNLASPTSLKMLLCCLEQHSSNLWWVNKSKTPPIWAHRKHSTQLLFFERVHSANSIFKYSSQHLEFQHFKLPSLLGTEPCGSMSEFHWESREYLSMGLLSAVLMLCG